MLARCADARDDRRTLVELERTGLRRVPGIGHCDSGHPSTAAARRATVDGGRAPERGARVARAAALGPEAASEAARKICSLGQQRTRLRHVL